MESNGVDLLGFLSIETTTSQAVSVDCEYPIMEDTTIDAWLKRTNGNIRAMLASLHEVLWNDHTWKQVNLSELINPHAVKKHFTKAQLVIHPDKVIQKGGDKTQLYIANKIFHATQTAFNKFSKQEL
jgi:hypothetical protein